MGVYIKGVGKEELIDILRYENVFDAIDVSEFIEVEEPLDKDINVRSKTEPQYDIGEYADRLWKIAYERGKREALEQAEPQKICKYCNGKCSWWVDGNCMNDYCRFKPKTEPQTDCDKCCLIKGTGECRRSRDKGEGLGFCIKTERSE